MTSFSSGPLRFCQQKHSSTVLFSTFTFTMKLTSSGDTEPVHAHRLIVSISHTSELSSVLSTKQFSISYSFLYCMHQLSSYKLLYLVGQLTSLLCTKQLSISHSLVYLVGQLSSIFCTKQLSISQLSPASGLGPSVRACVHSSRFYINP